MEAAKAKAAARNPIKPKTAVVPKIAKPTGGAANLKLPEADFTIDKKAPGMFS
jgi:hypothetical protein